MKLALVHDYFREWGGAEEVVKALHELWPEAPIYTSYVSGEKFTFKAKTLDDRSVTSNATISLEDVHIKTTWLNLLPQFIKSSKITTPLLPFAFASFQFKGYDIVISSAAAFAKSIDVNKPTIHICYCHTPPRFLYGLQREHAANRASQIAEKPVNAMLRWLDQKAAQRVDYFIANSHVVAKRIKDAYHKDATVIYPPVDINKFSTQDSIASLKDDKTYFVILGRLSPIKHFEIAVEACTKLDLPLKVIGTGSHEAYLRSIAGPSVEFLGRIPTEQITQILAGSKALINTVFDEDFGMVPIEVLGAGIPVIAYASDAAKETMVNGETGEFFFEPTSHSLTQVLENFNDAKYDPQVLTSHAQQFSKDRFVSEITTFISNLEPR